MRRNWSTAWEGWEACTFWLSSRMGRERGFAPPASDVGSGVAANTMLIGKVIINAIETGKFVDGDQLTIEGESVDGGVVHDCQTRKLARAGRYFAPKCCSFGPGLPIWVACKSHTTVYVLTRPRLGGLSVGISLQ